MFCEFWCVFGDSSMCFVSSDVYFGVSSMCFVSSGVYLESVQCVL